MNVAPLFSRIRLRRPAAMGNARSRRWTLKAQCSVVALIVGIAAPAFAAWAFQNGGLQDLSTGLVWSQSQYQETNSWWTFDVAPQRAANYVTYDLNGDAYSDWRLPRVKELQTAIANGTLNQVLPRDAVGIPLFYTTFFYQTSEMRGKQHWVVDVVFDPVTGQVIGGGRAWLTRPGGWSDLYFVRP
jgi:hypothetical protein